MDDAQQAGNSFDTMKAIGILIFALVFVGIFVSRLLSDHGISLSLSDNILEKALRVGVSDRAQFEDFKNKGGLDNEASWKGYHVFSISNTYDDQTTKLAILNIELTKSWPSNKLASIDNLKDSLSPDCGSQWTQNQAQRFGSMFEARKGNSVCSIQDSGDHALVTVMQR